MGPVQKQYERWVYPSPIADLETHTREGHIDGSAPKAHHLQYWPDGRYFAARSIDVLVAGCGSNAAARIAYTHPEARVVGIDVSASSLAHEHFLKEKHGLDNLTLHELPLESVAELKQGFDFVDCIGVLHHLPDPEAGLSALGEVLRPDGVMAIMLYGRHGRAGVAMLQQLFRMLDMGQEIEDVGIAREIASRLLPQHPASHLLATDDMDFDAGVVDLLLHVQEQRYDVAECLALVAACGMRFQGWLEPFPYHPEGQLPRRLSVTRRIASLPREQQWQAMELVHGLMSAHSFYVCRRDRPSGQFVLAWQAPEALAYVPHPRVHRSEVAMVADGVQGGVIQRLPYGPVPLTPLQYQLFLRADGRRTISEIARVDGSEVTPSSLEAARELFERLARIGLVHCQIERRS